MRVITARNVHEALPLGLKLLAQEGIERESRNGPVRVMPCPVTTVYEKPCERVIFWPERDANPFFHLYESLWMLAGRNDLAPLVKYASNMANFSDDGVTLWGAYGHRWRHFAKDGIGNDTDQLVDIATTLRKNPEDRRCILQMWDVMRDLGRNGKDLPCNTMATFQRDAKGKLDLTVFCRSNDIVWGAYGANAVHFSMLLEYMALWIGCPVGVYRQVSVNWHGYLSTLKPLDGFYSRVINTSGFIPNPYLEGKVFHPRVVAIPMETAGDIHEVSNLLGKILSTADRDGLQIESPPSRTFAWAFNVWKMLEAHEVYRHDKTPTRYDRALEILANAHENCDWVVAAQQWVTRRKERFMAAATS